MTTGRKTPRETARRQQNDLALKTQPPAALASKKSPPAAVAMPSTERLVGLW